jgi:hypothetical protein
MVVPGELAPRHLGRPLLQGQFALRLIATLLFRRNVVVVDIAYQLTR